MPNAKLSPIWPYRQWLQRDRAAVSADQHLGTQTQTYGNVAAGTYVISSERALADLAVPRKNSPEQRSASCHANINANAPDRACVDVLLSRSARNENTSHVLPRAEDQSSDPRIGVACQPTDSKRHSRLRLVAAPEIAGLGTLQPICQPESKTARPVPLSSAINPHDRVLTGTAIRNFRGELAYMMPMSCARVDRKKP